MEVIVLGSGTSQGVPMIGCTCAVCTSADPRNRRTRTSIHVVMDGLHVQVDAAPEFRLQCLKEGVDWLDFFILTHGHSDHVAGMDDLRRFCDLRGGEALTVHTTAEGMARVRSIYPYAIAAARQHPGVPGLQPRGDAARDGALRRGRSARRCCRTGARRRSASSSRRGAAGAKFAYYTDCKRLTPRRSLDMARGCDAAILDGLRPHAAPVAHEHRRGGRGRAGRSGAKQVWLTHLTHLTDHAVVEATLPPGFALAYDGLRIRL